jgi:diguanylate cyclase (GGDEF)-like protein
MLNFVFAFLSAISVQWGLIEIAPGLKTKSYYLHMASLLVMAVMNFFLKGNELPHILIYYMIVMLWLMLAYRTSSFIAAITAVLLFIAQIFSALITSNISLFALNRVYDFRVLFSYHDGLAILFFAGVYIFVIKYYHWMMRLFKNIVSLDRYHQRIIVISDLLIFSLFIVYQRYTFANLVSIVHADGVILVDSVKHYMLYSYLALTAVAMFLILMINRQLIIDNNLARYKFKAEVDPMTGVLSRDAGIGILREEMKNAVRLGTELTIAYIDVDDLKFVNDKFGHNEGNRLLKQITEIIQGNLRELDIIARLGGDEFMIVFSKCGQQQAGKVWRRIQDEFAQMNRNGTLPYGISASVGFTQFDAVKHRSVSALLHEADGEMYNQKKSSKNKFSSKYKRN